MPNPHPSTIEKAAAERDKKTGERVAHARRVAGMTQAELAKKMGRSAQNISHWETGRNRLKTDDARRLAGILECELDWLITGRGAAPERFGAATRATDASARSPSFGLVPLLSDIMFNANGPDVPASTIARWVPVEADVGPRTFAIEVMDRSLGKFLPPGSTMIIDPDAAPVPDELAAAMIGDQPRPVIGLLQVIGPDKNGVAQYRIVALSDAHPSYSIDAMRPGRIIGPVVEYRAAPPR